MLRTEAAAIERVAATVVREAETAAAWSSALDALEACRGHVVVLGMGKSGLVGAKISASF